MLQKTLAFLAAASAILIQAVAPSAGQNRAYRNTIAEGTAKVIPADLQAWLMEHLAEIEEAAHEPEELWPREADKQNREDWHFVYLDLGATDTSTAARLAAARDFPHRSNYRRGYAKRHNVPTTGQLPWILAGEYDTLVSAFRTGQEEEILHHVGLLIYFAGKAAQPHAVSRDGDGRNRGHIVSEDASLGDPAFAHRDPLVRMFGELVRRNQSRYGRSLDLSTADYAPAKVPTDVIFDAMEHALGVIEPMLTADAECVERMGLADIESLAERADEYYLLLDEKAGTLCTEQLRQGALLAANLIGGAWESAGAPTVTEIQTRGLTTAKPATESVNPKDIVGSINSNVFHYAECRFAKNISPENLVKFESALAARREGRRQCRACKPE